MPRMINMFVRCGADFSGLTKNAEKVKTSMTSIQKSAAAAVSKLESELSKAQKSLQGYYSRQAEIEQSFTRDLAEVNKSPSKATRDQQTATLEEMMAADNDKLDAQYADKLDNLAQVQAALDREKEKQAQITEEIKRQAQETAQVALETANSRVDESNAPGFDPGATNALNGNFVKTVEIAKLRVEELKASLSTITEQMNTAFASGDYSAVQTLFSSQTAAYNKLLSARKRLEIEVKAAAQKQAAAEEAAAQKAAAAQERAAQKAERAQKKAAQESTKAHEKSSTRIKSAFSTAFSTLKNKLSQAGKSANSFGSRLKSIVAGALVFNVLSSALRKMTDYIGTAISSSSQMQSALANLKGAAMQAASPLIQALTPALTALANAAATVLHYMAKLISFFTGRTVSAVSTASNKIQGAAGAAKKAMASLAGFDEITKLNDSSSGGGGAGSSAVDPNLSFEGQSPFLDSLMASITNGDWNGVGAKIAEKLNGCLQSINWPNIKEKAYSWASGIADGINGFVTNFDFAELGNTIGQSLNTVIGSIRTFFEEVDWNAVGAGLSTGITSMFESIDWEEIKRTVLASLGAVLDFSEGFLENLGLLQGIDFTVAKDSMAQMNEKLTEFTETAGGALKTVWEEVLKPLAKWSMEEAGPKSIEAFNAATDSMSNSLGPVVEGLAKFREQIDPLVEFIRGIAIDVIEQCRETFQGFADMFEEKGGKIIEICDGIGIIVRKVWNVVEPILAVVWGVVKSVFTFVADCVSNAIGTVIDVLAGVINFIAGIFTLDFERAWEGIKGIFVGFATSFLKVINSVIGFINGFISAIYSGINSAIKAINRIDFTIPDWVPGWGGKHFGPNIKTLTAPSIPTIPLPKLAKGAVIPPNREFMAVLGDQRHGTNIETPESLLRQIFQEELGDLISSNMAGHEATVGVLQEILQAVLGISIGDDVIAGAVDRHQRKLAIISGGVL